ncbi:hypothetical protein [Chitinimonas sp.]|uniref:HD domain-containing protein n=1 Tax=Chitinimonas sp. TaxID=1934313 RepID=UPI002F94B8CB
MMKLKMAWRQSWQELGVAEPNMALCDTLLAAYAEPHRHYHTQQHLLECLELLTSVRSHAEYPAEIEIALWFHDAIYAMGRQDNEARSADWAREAILAQGLAVDCAERVHALIMATCHNTEPMNRDAQLMVDVDLGILGAEPARFSEYEQQIRKEYAWVPGFVFKHKRREVLRGFLERARLYSDPALHAQREKCARLNLQAATT